MKIKKVLIFGATGGTGRELVRQSLDLGYSVSVFIHHNASSLGGLVDKVTVYHGDARNYESVNTALKGKDAVLVALGAIPGKKDFVLSKSTTNIVRAMKKNNIKRLVVETGAALVEDRTLLPAIWRLMSSLYPMKVMFDDKRKQEEAIRGSNLDCVIVRPANLTNGERTDCYRTAEALKLSTSSKVSRSDVAHFMIEQLEHDKFVHKSVMISG